MEVNNKSSEDQSSEESHDLKLLIECLKLDVSLSYQEQALKTIASLCRTSDAASGYLVHSDALQYILEITFKPISPHSLKVACLHVLCAACENNALVQNVLCKENIFLMLRKFLTMKSHTKLQTLSAYLLICVISNNERGQVLARRSKTLETLRYIFKDVCSPTCSPSNPKRMLECLAADSEGKTELINLWQTATNALSVCVNNPQNKENQFYCSSVFPAAVAYLRNSQSPLIQTTTLTFLTNCLANNNRAQVSFRLVGGLRVLCDVLREELSPGTQVPSSVMSALVMTLEAAVCRNQICRSSTAELEIIPVLLQCLQLCFATQKFKVACLMAIASCIEECASNCEAFFRNDGIAIVIKLLAENQNCEELQKTATCVLHTYMEQTKSSDSKSMDEILTSKSRHVSPAHIEKPNNCSIPSTLVEANGERTNVPQATQNDINACDDECGSAGSMVNQIKDLTNENNNTSFIASGVDESVVDVINAVWNSDAMPGSATEDEMKELHPSTNTTNNMKELHTSSHINTSSNMKQLRLHGKTNTANNSNNNQCYQFENLTTKVSPIAAKPIDAKPIDAKPIHAKPIHAKPIHAKPIHAKPIHAKSIAAKLSDAKPSDAIPSDAKPIAAKPSDARPTDAKSSDAKPIDAKSIDDNDDYGDIFEGDGDGDGEDIFDGTNLAKAQYGETSKRQAMVTAKKRSRVMIEKNDPGCPSKRPFRPPLNSLGNDELGDIFVGADTTSESSGEETSVKDVNKCFEAFFTRRKKSSKVNRTRPLHQDQKSNAKTSKKCLGCKLDFNKVNSRNLLSTLRTSIHTCPVHRDYLVRVQSTINSYKRSLETQTRSPNFEFAASPRMNSQCDMSPEQILQLIKLRPKIANVAKIPFSRRDVETLRDGVREHGESWTMISEICPFLVERSPKILKQKFKSIKKGINAHRRKKLPFTSQEEHNLKKGVLKFGYRWRRIMSTFEFENTRTPQDLKDKWRNLIK